MLRPALAGDSRLDASPASRRDIHAAGLDATAGMIRPCRSDALRSGSSNTEIS